jgi:hypothetical protein
VTLHRDRASSSGQNIGSLENSFCIQNQTRVGNEMPVSSEIVPLIIHCLETVYSFQEKLTCGNSQRCRSPAATTLKCLRSPFDKLVRKYILRRAFYISGLRNLLDRATGGSSERASALFYLLDWFDAPATVRTIATTDGFVC